MSTQIYKYTGTAELHKHNRKQNQIRMHAGLISYSNAIRLHWNSYLQYASNMYTNTKQLYK